MYTLVSYMSMTFFSIFSCHLVALVLPRGCPVFLGMFLYQYIFGSRDKNRGFTVGGAPQFRHSTARSSSLMRMATRHFGVTYLWSVDYDFVFKFKQLWVRPVLSGILNFP